MRFIFIAVITVLILLAGASIYLATRPAPAATVISSGACTPGSCPIPLTCDGASGKCVDTTLPRAIADAQASSEAFYGMILNVVTGVQQLIGKLYMINSSLIEIKSLVGYDGATGAQSAIVSMTAQLTGLLTSLNGFVNKQLSTPGCTAAAAAGGQCGYVALVGVLTPNTSSAGQIISAGLQGIALAKFTTPFLASLQGVVSYCNTQINQTFPQMWQDYNNYGNILLQQLANINYNPQSPLSVKIQYHNSLESGISEMLDSASRAIGRISTWAAALPDLNKACLADGAALVSHYDIPGA